MSDDTGDPPGPTEVWIGPIGPIPVRSDEDGLFASRRGALRVAQAATTCDELVALVRNHPNPLVRMEAVPRLKARFPDSEVARSTLERAVSDRDDGVRCEAIGAVADLAFPGAGDLLAAALNDPEPDLRYFAAIGLQQLDDARAPADPTAFACGS